MNHGSCGGLLAYSGILNPLCTVSEFCFDLSNSLMIQFQHLELFSLFRLIVWYPAGSEKWVTLDGACKGDWSGRLQEIPQLIIIYEIWLQPTSRRFLKELDEASGGNNLHYILQCLHVPALVTRVWTRKVRWVATECSQNDGSKTQYYIVILDQLQGRSRALERALESRIRGPLIFTPPPRLLCLEAMVPGLKRVLKSVRQMCLGAAGCFR